MQRHTSPAARLALATLLWAAWSDAGKLAGFQAARVAQSMFTLWDVGWDNAPYYLYRFSLTADTRQDFGLVRFPSEDKPAVFSDAWYAFRTIAQTFYDRERLEQPDFAIRLEPALVLETDGGTRIGLAPPCPVLRAFVRNDRQLLIYLAYTDLRYPLQGRWDLVLDSPAWGGPQQIPLHDYRERVDMRSDYDGERLVIENVAVGVQPTIVTLRRRLTRQGTTRP